MNKIAKFFKSKWLFLSLVAAALSTCVASAVFVVQTGMDFSPNFETVAVNTATNKEYHRVEAALSEATSGQTVYLKTGTDPVLFKDAEVKPGVTFAVPHTNNVIQLDGIPEKENETLSGVSTPDKCTNTLTINPNVTLRVNGTLSVGGQTSGGASGREESGQTAGLYGAILMKDNAKIIVGNDSNRGILSCTGFVFEENQNNGSIIDVHNGDFKEPFLVGDHRGGTAYMAIGGKGYIKKHNWSPIKEYALMNAQCLVKIGYKSKLTAYCNLYESIGGNHYTEGNIVGNDANSLIQLNSAAGYFTMKYDISAVDKSGKQLKISDCYLYGSAKMNGMKLSLGIAGIGTIDTANAFFPLTYMQRFHCCAIPNDPNLVSVPNRLQLLPGSSLTIHEGVDFHTYKMTVYDFIPAGSPKPGFNDTNFNWGGCHYTINETGHPSTQDAELIVNGNFVSDTEIGGLIQTTKNTGKLLVSGQFSCYSEELTDKDGNLIEINNPARGETWPSTTKFGLPYRDYVSTGSAWKPGDPVFSINYKAVLPDMSIVDIPGVGLPETFKTNTVDLAIGTGDIVAGHEFNGQWYLNANLNTGLLNNKLSYESVKQFISPEDGSLTLYGEYIVSNKVTIVYADGKIKDQIIEASSLPASYTVNEGDVITMPDPKSIKYLQTDVNGLGIAHIDYDATSWKLCRDVEGTIIIADGLGNGATHTVVKEDGQTIYIIPNINPKPTFLVVINHNYGNPGQANTFCKITFGSQAYSFKNGKKEYWLGPTDVINFNLSKKLGRNTRYTFTITKVDQNGVSTQLPQIINDSAVNKNITVGYNTYTIACS